MHHNSISNLLRGLSDWLLSPVVVVSIRGDFLTSFLVLMSWRQKQHKSHHMLGRLNAITLRQQTELFQDTTRGLTRFCFFCSSSK